MNDRPSAVELVAASRQFLETELLPTLSDPRLRFRTLIAANILAIAEREILSEQGQLDQEWNVLLGLEAVAGLRPAGMSELRQAVIAGNRSLCAHVRAGAWDEPARFRQLLRVVRQGVIEKLRIANPRSLSTS